MIYAHSIPNKPEEFWQTLEEHLDGVSARASQFASSWAPLTAGLLGLIHDKGKCSSRFQARLRGKGYKVDHTTAAYLCLLDAWDGGDPHKAGYWLAKFLAYPLLGHHGGMLDAGSDCTDDTLGHRISESRLMEVPEWKTGKDSPLPGAECYLKELTPLMRGDEKKLDSFAAAFLLRMLFSCLVDADYLDTERFCSPDRHSLRQAPSSLASLENNFFHYLQSRGFLQEAVIPESALEAGPLTEPGPVERVKAIGRARSFMLQKCIGAADGAKGFFYLTMPTGGGKTLSSMAFALRHAVRHGLKRIIYVVPYTSIIEQNADVFRQALGEDAVLEHHSNYSLLENPDGGSGEKEELEYKLATENWDASVIVTTSVQFFESLFDNRPSRCRKLHNIAESVIILDEAQMLPVPFLKPCLAALKTLVQGYGSTVVLCTATQPALLRSNFLPDGLAPEDVASIIPARVLPSLFAIFERARVEIWKEPVDDEQLARFMEGQPQALCIVNSRRHAAELFALLEDGEENYCLTARLTPAHRTLVLAKVRERLAAGMPCRVICTSLIECGVDISFPVVMREKNGLDVLAQSAGRCNRESQGRKGRVISFSSTRSSRRSSPELNRRRNAFDQVAQDEDIFSPAAVRKYFEILYSDRGSNLDEENILKRTDIDQLSVNPWKFDFATIRKKFQFIDDDTASIVIECGEAAELLRMADQNGALPSSVLRRLQRHSVQVYRHELMRMIASGRVEEWYNGLLHVLCGGVGYNEKTGLDIELENGVPVEDLLF